MQKLTNENIKDIYKLSPMQEGMYYQYLLDKASMAYFQQMRFQFHDYLNIDVVKMSLKEIFKRYNILRTVFNHEKLDIPLQIVLKECENEVHYEDIKPMDIDSKKSYVENYIEQDKKRLFNLNKDILMRVSIFEVNENEYDFIWSFHHIIMDGWCLGIIISEFFEIYNSFIETRDYKLPVVKQYRKYIDWLEKQDKNTSKEYWKNYLQGYNKMTGIPKSGIPAATGSAYLKDDIILNFQGQRLQEIVRLTSKNQVTMNTFIQTIWGIILSRYNSTNDVMFGAVVSGRPPEIDDIESMVGLFINTIPVRINYDRNDSFVDILKKVQDEAVKNKQHHYYPLYKIQSESPLKKNLIDHIVIFENYPTEELIGKNSNSGNGIGNTRITDFQAFEQTNYDFNIVVAVKDGLTVSFQYNTNIYERQLIQNISKQFATLIDQILADSNIFMDKLSQLSEEVYKHTGFTLESANTDKDLAYAILRPETTYVAPKTDNEKVVAEIWKEVLKIQEVGLNDNFFDLGGTSLDIITVISKINKKFGKEIPIVEMFTYPTIASICDFILNDDKSKDNQAYEDRMNEEALNSANTRMRKNISKLSALRGTNNED